MVATSRWVKDARGEGHHDDPTAHHVLPIRGRVYDCAGGRFQLMRAL
jgi:hypothetical protein